MQNLLRMQSVQILPVRLVEIATGAVLCGQYEVIYPEYLSVVNKGLQIWLIEWLLRGTLMDSEGNFHQIDTEEID